MQPFLRYASEKKGDIVALIRELVECESPSNDPAAVNRLVDLLVERTGDIASPKLFLRKGFGRHLRLDFKLPMRNRLPGGILGLGHSDTVWPVGTLRSMPFRERAGRLWGPGVLDMKAGLAFFVFACRALRDLDAPVRRHISLLITSDEEIGSEGSRSIIETEANKSKVALVVEPGTGLEGKLKTSRKGVGNYLLKVTGKASHAGVDFTSGASAVIELARQIQSIAAFTDFEKGITVNPGLIRGGTRTNVVAATAEAEIDIRVQRIAHARLLDQKFDKLKPFDKRCELTITGGLNRPPMERTPQIGELFAIARKLAGEIGVVLEESSTGGGSDGNFTAALGIPTLDGLGAVGEGAHAMHESILANRIADRTALLAGLLNTL